jgi:hypothetical protein
VKSRRKKAINPTMIGHRLSQGGVVDNLCIEMNLVCFVVFWGIVLCLLASHPTGGHGARVPKRRVAFRLAVSRQPA